MRSTESGFSERVYLVAAQERFTAASLALTADTPAYVVASYLAGVAVECLFHAYRSRLGADDTGRHDLRVQAEVAQFYQFVPRKQEAFVQSLVLEVALRWQNNHRYRSGASLKDWVIRNRLHIVEGSTAVRGDVVRFNAERLVDAAGKIVGIGVINWDNS